MRLLRPSPRRPRPPLRRPWPDGFLPHHGAHPAAERVAGFELEWLPAYSPGRFETVRVLESTCTLDGDTPWSRPCNRMVWELCSAGGARFLRRTTREGGEVTVVETPVMSVRAARDAWAALLLGVAR